MNKLTSKEWRSLLYEFTADHDGFRSALTKPFDQNGYVCATDGHAILRVSKKFVIEEYPAAGKVPNVAAIIPDSEPQFAVGCRAIRGGLLARGIDFDCLSVERPECHGRGNVSWKYDDKKGIEHETSANCPVCNGIGEVENGLYTFFTIGLCIFLGPYILRLYRVMDQLGLDAVRVSAAGHTWRFNLADGIDVILASCIPEKVHGTPWRIETIKLADL